MYERSAIVLERYFENYLDYRRESNLRDNFSNYCELVLKLEKYQINYQKEYEATQEYNESLKKIKAIQVAQEKLYKRSAKLEYNRNILFNTIDGKVEEIRKCIETIEIDVQKNNEAMNEEKEKFVAALEDYNDKRFELSKCKRYKKIAENDYNEIYEVARANFDGITEETLQTARAFSKFDDNNEIIEILEKNGKGEKIPFNMDVITDATSFGVEIAKYEVSSYLIIYEKMEKLLSDIEEGSAKIELHKKYLKNEKAKIDFIYAVKDYIVQFLDYERMTVIHGRKSHNRLMSEACESFNTDIIQINNLYELLLKEVSCKATKKAYKDLYNKSYLTEIKEKEERFKREKKRVNLNTATLINSNYWRIEGIRNIYTVFYKNVSDVFGREVEEFEIPKEFEEENIDEVEQENVLEDDEVVTDKKEKTSSVRMPFKTKMIVEDTIDNIGSRSEYEEDDEDDEDEDFDEDEEIKEEFMKNEKDDEDSNFNFNFEDFFGKDDSKEDIEIDEEDEPKIKKLSKKSRFTEVDEEDDVNEYDDEDEDETEVEDEKEPEAVTEEFDIFGDKYRDIVVTKPESIKEKNKLEKNTKVETSKIETAYENEDIPYEIEKAEEDLFEGVKKIGRKSKIVDIDEAPPTKEKNKKGLLKKMRKITNVKKNMANDVW